MNKKILSVVSVLGIAIGTMSIAGCGTAKKEPETTRAAESKEIKAKIEVTDSRGKKVSLDKPAEKIVCLLNSGLNDLEMLGAADRVIGIDAWTYSNEVTYKELSKIDSRIAEKKLPAVDDNMEKIVGMNPDLVIIWAQDTEHIKTLESNGIKVLGVQCDSFEDVDKKMENIGKVVGKEDRAKKIIETKNKMLRSVTEKTSVIKDADKKTGIFVWGATKLDLAGKRSTTGHKLLELAGVKDAAESINEEHFVAKMEDVITWNPQTIAMWNIKDLSQEDYYSDSQWKDITAVKAKSVNEISDNDTFYSDLWTVKYIYGAAYFAKNIYPEQTKDIDLNTFRSDMMKEFYGK